MGTTHLFLLSPIGCTPASSHSPSPRAYPIRIATAFLAPMTRLRHRPSRTLPCACGWTHPVHPRSSHQVRKVLGELLMPILWLVHVVCALALGNMAAAVVGGPQPWRELWTASPFVASSPIASRLHLGDHRLAIGGGEGLGWPASPPCASVAASVRARVPGDLAMVKIGCSNT